MKHRAMIKLYHKYFSLLTESVKLDVSHFLTRSLHCIDTLCFLIMKYTIYHVPSVFSVILCRHSNVNCEDDAGSCVREAAIKFADQNCEGPLDLILVTGQRALARNIKTLYDILSLRNQEDVRKRCNSDPY
jgi:hypothetical protein